MLHLQGSAIMSLTEWLTLSVYQTTTIIISTGVGTLACGHTSHGYISHYLCAVHGLVCTQTNLYRLSRRYDKPLSARFG